MARVQVGTVIDAPPRRVWDDVADVASHVEWMADADAIRFTSRQRQGVGTSLECDTRVGPLRLTDHMEVTEWEEGRLIGVRHHGLVTGTGRFTIGDEEQDLSQGHAVIARAGQPHGVRNESVENLVLLVTMAPRPS